jgi:putative ABC transport system permease protein
MTNVRQDLRFAWRALLRQPGFTIVATLTLALGIGATTAIFSVVNSVLLRPLPYPRSNRIAAVWQRPTDEPRELVAGQVSTANFRDWRAGAPAFEALAQYRNANLTLGTEDGAELIPGGEVTPAFFRVFGADPIVGRAFTEEEARFQGPAVAIVSHGFWEERLGGDAAAIGRTLRLQGRSYQVVGVAPPDFDFPNGARIWLPIQNDERGCGRGCVLFAGIGLLRTGATADVARAQLEGVAERLEREYPNENANTTADVALLRDVIVGNVRPALLVVFGAVVMVLLIACANVANLMLVRGTARQTEMGVRAVLGAGRGRLVAQLVTESGLLALVGAALGLLLAVWSVAVLGGIAAGILPRAAEIAIDGNALAFAVILAALTIGLFGLAPALQLSSTPFAQLLREGGRGTTGRHRARSVILAAEVALSVALLLGAGLMLRSLVRMQAVDPGFDPGGIAHFSVSLPDARYSDPAQAVRFIEDVRARLAGLPGVQGAAFIVGMPLGRTSIFGGFTRTDRPHPEPGQVPSASYRAIDADYLATMRIPVLAGRGFLPTDRADSPPVALINRRAAARFFPGEDPLGKTIDVQVSVGYPDTLPRTIVGVVGDVRARSLMQEPEPAVYTPQAQAGAGFGAFVIRSGGTGDDVLRAAREVVRAVDPQVPLVRPGTMAELLAGDTGRQRFYVVLLGAFAALAATLAAVGMYGVVAFVVAQRTREIGVRMALGARARHVVSLVVWQGLRPALLGAAIGMAGAFALGRVIAGLLYETPTQDPLTIVGVVAVLLAVVGFACTVPARRATRVPPAMALRAE